MQKLPPKSALKVLRTSQSIISRHYKQPRYNHTIDKSPSKGLLPSSMFLLLNVCFCFSIALSLALERLFLFLHCAVSCLWKVVSLSHIALFSLAPESCSSFSATLFSALERYFYSKLWIPNSPCSRTQYLRSITTLRRLLLFRHMYVQASRYFTMQFHSNLRYA